MGRRTYDGHSLCGVGASPWLCPVAHTATTQAACRVLRSPTAGIVSSVVCYSPDSRATKARFIVSSHNKHGTRDSRDFYATPEWCVSSLYSALPADFPKPTMDPCAGNGAICTVANCRGIELDSDLAEQAKARGVKILTGNGLYPLWVNQHIIVNPPYKDALRWVQKGVKEATTCCALLRLGFLASSKRHTFWLDNPPAHLLVLSSRPSFTGDGKTDSADYMWAVWDRDNWYPKTKIHWIRKPDATLQVQML